MALRRNPLRSSRSTGVAPSNIEGAWFPDVKDPDSIIHRRVNMLNREAYPHEMFARADDLIIFVAFVNKGKKRRSHAVSPEPAQPQPCGDDRNSTLDFEESEGQEHPPEGISNEEGTLGAKICRDLFSGKEPSWETAVKSVKALQEQIKAFQREDKRWSACLSHAKILKVTHTRKKATFGLKAARKIPSGSFIMETCSSMSRDPASSQGPSVIEPAPKQLGPQGPRLILGPFRFVNHDCKPNAQIFPIPETYACVIEAIEDIEADTEITVSYLPSGYYGERCLCSSCTHVDTSDLSVLKPHMQKQPGSSVRVERALSSEMSGLSPPTRAPTPR